MSNSGWLHLGSLAIPRVKKMRKLYQRVQEYEGKEFGKKVESREQETNRRASSIVDQ